MSILHSSPALHPHAVREAWIAVAVSPVGLVLAVAIAFVLGGVSTGSWVGGSLLAVLALVAPTVGLVLAREADREHAHGAGVALAAAVVDWVLVVAVLALAVVSAVAALVAVTVSACVVLVTWGNEPAG